jgi:hypothetical protein
MYNTQEGKIKKQQTKTTHTAKRVQKPAKETQPVFEISQPQDFSDDARIT